MQKIFLVIITLYSSVLLSQGEFISVHKQTFTGHVGALTEVIPDISVTNIADGFAKFIVKRGKAEAKLLFIDEFGNKFMTDSFFITLFPYTSNFIRTDLDLNNGANNITATLRETINKDINNLYFNVPKLNYFKNSELRSYYTIVSGLLNKTKSQVTVSNMMSDLDIALTNSNINVEVKKRIHTILTLYSSLVEPTTSRMASLQQIILLKTDSTLRADYFKALRGKYSEDPLIGAEIIDLIEKRESELIDFLCSLTEYNERIIALYNNIITSADGIKKTILLKEYQSTMIEFIGIINDVLNNNSIKSFPNGKAPIINNIKVLYDLYFDIKTENYSSALLDLSFLLRQLYDERLNKQENRLVDLVAKGAKAEDFKNEDKISNMIIEQKIELLKFLEAIGFYREFLAGIVNAKSSEEIEALIERSALPVGSSILKKKNAFTFEIGSYLGANLNPNSPVASNDAWQQKFGVTAPIGFNFSFGMGKMGKGGSISLFVPLIDVGAIAAYRFKDSTSFEFNLKPENILSPGFYFIYGLPKYPISIGYGFQYGPSLNKVINPQSVIVNNPTLRSNIVLSVDIPLWKLGQTRKKWIDSTFAISLLVDEDWLDYPRNQDRNYTGGVGIDIRGRSVYANVGKHFDPIRFLNINEVNYPEFNRSSSLQLSTSIFTPKNLRADTAIYDDRPYSNLTVLTLRNNYDYTSSTLITPRRLYYDISIGVIGSFIGREFQTKIHELVGDTANSPIPMGWSNQISNGGKPTGMIKVGYEFSPYLAKLIDKWRLFNYLEYKLSVSSSIGYYTQQQAGASLRLGLFRSNWYNFISDGNPNSLHMLRTKDRKWMPKVEFYIFGDAKVYYMAYNSLLRGQTSYYNYSKVKLSESQVNNNVFEGNLGACLGFKNFLLTTKWSYRTPEIKVQNYTQHTWGSIYLTYRRSF